MFTGIVESIGSILKVESYDTTQSGGQGYSLEIASSDSSFLEDVKLGDSISINGIYNFIYILIMTRNMFNSYRNDSKVF